MRILWSATGLALVLGVIAACTASAATPLDSLIAAERAVAALSVERGLKEAFLANLADDAVLFRPVPVNGMRLWRARPASTARLAWAPDFAEIAGAGDLGVTSGPWELRAPPERNQPPAYGHFITVWRRAKGGAFRAAIDIGVEHPRPEGGVDTVDLALGPTHPKPPPPRRDFGGQIFGGGTFSSGTGVGVSFGSGGPGYVPIQDRLMAHAINDMMKAERSLIYVTRNRGVERAYPEHAAADVRVYRTGSFPTVGVSEALPALSKHGRKVQIEPWGDGMSSSRDLGYSYVLLIARTSAASHPDTASYMHVWRRDEAGRYKLAIDVENEFPKRK